MKTNFILSLILIGQILALLFSTSEVHLDQSLAIKLSARAALDPELNGRDLQRHLDQLSIQVTESQEAFGIKAEQLKEALRSPRVDPSLIETIEVETASRNVYTLSFTQRDRSKSRGLRKLTLTRAENGNVWSIPEMYDYPADPQRVRALLKKILAIKLNMIIARQPMSHARLRVISL